MYDSGSNTGIGKSTALDLAKRGARVILACRNKQKAEAAVYDIRKVNISLLILSIFIFDLVIHNYNLGFAITIRYQNNLILNLIQESGNNEVLYMQLDLASLKSVRSFAETFLKTEPRLDLLINNAGLGRVVIMLSVVFCCSLP